MIYLCSPLLKIHSDSTDRQWVWLQLQSGRKNQVLWAQANIIPTDRDKESIADLLPVYWGLSQCLLGTTLPQSALHPSPALFMMAFVRRWGLYLCANKWTATCWFYWPIPILMWVFLFTACFPHFCTLPYNGLAPSLPPSFLSRTRFPSSFDISPLRFQPFLFSLTCALPPFLLSRFSLLKMLHLRFPRMQMHYSIPSLTGSQTEIGTYCCDFIPNIRI